MTGSHFALLRFGAAGAVCLAAAVLMAVAPPNDFLDLSMETSQEVLKERVIAPIKWLTSQQPQALRRVPCGS